jgi:hypothetical protein
MYRYRQKVASRGARLLRAENSHRHTQLTYILGERGAADTLDYLVTVWNLLRKISMRVENLPGYQNITDSPLIKSMIPNSVMGLAINNIPAHALKGYIGNIEIEWYAPALNWLYRENFLVLNLVRELQIHS